MIASTEITATHFNRAHVDATLIAAVLRDRHARMRAKKVAVLTCSGAISFAKTGVLDLISASPDLHVPATMRAYGLGCVSGSRSAA